MSASKVGAAWTLEEEQRLYEATCRGETLHEIAAAHGRMTGGIRARQKHMGLRDATGDLIVPTPAFRSALKPQGGAEGRRVPAAVLPSSAPGADRAPRHVAASSPATAEPNGEPASKTWPAGFPHGGDWIEKLWCALRHDAEALLGRADEADPRAARILSVMLARLTPQDDLHPSKTLTELGDAYGVSRERIRQIQAAAERRLKPRVLKADSVTKRVLDAMTDAAPTETEEGVPLWFAIELAQGDCRQEFMEFILTAVLRRCGDSRISALLLTSEAVKAERAARRAERPRTRRRRDGEALRRAEDADAFVRDILRKSTWPERLRGRAIDFSGMQPLRDCRSERSWFSRSLKRKVGYDSQGERRLIRALDHGAMVTDFLEQPLEIPYDYQGRSRLYVPDVLIRVDDDLFFVIEIKARQRLADDLTLAKAEAAERHLGARGIGYCLADAEGFGLSDLRALNVDDRFDRALQLLLADRGALKRQAFERAFERDLDAAYDQLQAIVLRDRLGYETSMWADERSPTGLGFDFLLSRQA